MPKPKNTSSITSAVARRAFANRTRTSGEGDKPSVRTRHPLGAAFRQWVRSQYGKAAREQLSPKLARIVHGAG